ncbi:MAG: hypothetical protein M5R36_29275 [Deltaproteobacteria bacterium]|nr:hypothetical protein [Deltaproteobacteria bacterium]
MNAVTPATAEALADAVGTVLDAGETDWERRVEEHRRLAERFSWDRIAGEHLDHYRKVIACASR